MFWPGEPTTRPGEPLRRKRPRERRRLPGRSFENPSAHHHSHSGCNSPNFPPPHGRFIPELTAASPAEPDNEKQVQEAKTGLGATHLSLCHLDLDFAGVEDARSEEPILSGEADTALLGPPALLRPHAPGKASAVSNLCLPQTASWKPGCCHFLLFPLVGGVSWADSQNIPS